MVTSRALKAHDKGIEKLVKTLKKAIAEYDKAKPQMDEIRKSMRPKRLSMLVPLMAKAAYEKNKFLEREQAAFRELEEANAARKKHLEELQSVRGQISDYLYQHGAKGRIVKIE